jgi:hypothetical protein
MDHADRKIRLADVDIDDLPIDTGTLVDELDFFGGDVSGAFRILGQRCDRKQQYTKTCDPLHMSSLHLLIFLIC